MDKKEKKRKETKRKEADVIKRLWSNFAGVVGYRDRLHSFSSTTRCNPLLSPVFHKLVSSVFHNTIIQQIFPRKTLLYETEW